jgi:DNA topoisomerase I
MAFDSYQPHDVKQTVEKAVKEKPKPSELIKVEREGFRKDYEEDKKEIKSETKKRKRKKDFVKSKITFEKKRDSVLIITEKPQAANKIAMALSNEGRLNKYFENKVPFYEIRRNGERIIVASAVGHIFNLTYEKGQSGWPIFDIKWEPSYRNKGAAFTKNYYNLLKKLVGRAKSFVVATDYDVEGEVIGWNVLRFIAKEKDAKRMKYSTLTKNELVNSYENLLETLDWGQAYAGEARHKLDWFYGINLSRGLMMALKKTGSFKVLSVGRVQGPALKIIVDRDKEIKKFRPEKYWQVFAQIDLRKLGIEEPEKLKLKHPKDIFDEKELSDFEEIKEGVVETKEKEENLAPPHPFDLTTLQREAHRVYRISPSNTLRIAQSLYLDSIISYPRTSSQKIPKEIEPKKILKKLEVKFPYAKLATRKNPVEGKKLDPAHPSIYPTGEFKKLNEDEEKIYNLIVRRFVSCFMEDVKTANKRIVLSAETNKGEKKFTASGLVVLERSWLDVYPIKLEENNLPTLNTKTKVEKIIFEEKETQPPKRYTSASLVSLLEKRNLGTKTTRSMIVDTLFARGYLDGKSITATSLGEKLIETLEKYSPIIVDENLTRQLEEKMEEIQNAKSNWEKMEDDVIEKVKKLIIDISKEFNSHELEIGKNLLSGIEKFREQERQNNILIPCKTCGNGNLTIRYSKKIKRYFVGCDSYPECKSTYSLPPNALIKKTDKKNEEGLPILQALRKGKRPWEFVFDPDWRAKQGKKEEQVEKKEEE